MGLNQECIELPALATILQVASYPIFQAPGFKAILQAAFCSCIGMLTVITNSLHNIKMHAPYLKASS